MRRPEDQQKATVTRKIRDRISTLLRRFFHALMEKRTPDRLADVVRRAEFEQSSPAGDHRSPGS
jgi:DnaJ-domain-containing protein 1